MDDAEIPLGSIGLTQIHGEVGRLIRLGEYLNGDGFGPWEHAFVYVGNGQIVEAEPHSARVMPLSEYDPATVIWLRCPLRYGAAVAASAKTLIGTPYSFLDYLAIALHRLHIPAPSLRSYIASTSHMLCSQLADEAARRGGWRLFDDGRWAGFVTPADLAALARQQNERAA